jgi:hypothetical protein
MVGVAGQFAAMFLADRWKHLLPHEAWILAIGALPLVVMLGLAAAITSRRHRRRQQEIAERLKTLGFECRLAPSPEESAAFLTPLEPLVPALGLRESGGNLQWLAVQEHSQGQARLLEFQYYTGSGETLEEHRRTVVIWPATRSDLPGARLGQLAGFLAERKREIERRGKETAEPNDRAFAELARKWTLIGDTVAAARFLAPAVRPELVESPEDENWCFGSGWACCSFPHPLDADNLARFLDRARRILTPAP